MQFQISLMASTQVSDVLAEFKYLSIFYLRFCFLQGGLKGLAAVAVGLKEKAPAYLEVLPKCPRISFLHKDYIQLTYFSIGVIT